MMKGMNEMKKTISVFLCVLLTIFCAAPAAFAAGTAGTTYYFDSIDGSDETGDGLSPGSARRSVPAELSLNAGDSVLFRRGGEYECTLTLNGCSGTAAAPITIGAYGEGKKPLLTTSARTEVLRLFDCSYVTVSDLEITAPVGGGIWIDTLTAVSEGITLSGLSIHNIQNYKVTNRDDLSAGAARARACVMVKGLGARSLYPVNDLTVTDCEFYDCGNGISLWGALDSPKGNPEGDKVGPGYNKNSLIKDCYFHDMDAEAVIIGVCDGALMTHCRVIDCCQGEGVDENGNILYFTAAAWFWGSENSTIEYCEIAGQKNVGDGMAVDFDSQTNNCTYQYIYSHDNMRFMVNNAKTTMQTGNTVRYCLSVNDDKGKNVLAGGPGEKDLRFYNNTIVGSQVFDMQNIIDSRVVNNIIVVTDGYRLNTSIKPSQYKGSVIGNNCYYNCVSAANSGAKFNTLPGFSGEDFSDAASFTLSKDSPLIGAGVAVPGDDCTVDFFGNEIKSVNIGCYCGEGTDTPYTREPVFQKVIRFFRNLFYMIKGLIDSI